VSGRPLLRDATSSDLSAIRRLLQDAQLPLDGLDDCARLWVLDEEGQVVGAVGFELHGQAALLRSLVVDSSWRGRGLGLQLVQNGVKMARQSGAKSIHGLTTTIPDLLARLGWTEVPRSKLPADLAASRELQGACPATARAFSLEL